MLEDGTILDEDTGTFEIKSPYIPPPPPVEISLSPSAPATLKTADGRVIVSFPSGAVVSEARVALRNYPLDQLPSPPAGFTLAATAFRLEGVNGLLARQATVNVEYSPSDLLVAHNDVSTLVLGRWDEIQGRWFVLRTRLDKEDFCTRCDH